MNPIIKGKAASPGTLKIGLISLSHHLPIWWMILVWDKSSVMTKKGNKEGTTLLAHNNKPFFVAIKLLFEKITKQKAKITSKKGKIFLLKDKKINLIVNLLVFMNMTIDV